MSPFGLGVTGLGLAAFLAGLLLAAWRGQDPDGRWRTSAWRYGGLAAIGLALLLVGLWLAGAPATGQHYPP
ncbi:MAG: hypothetical protein HYU66_27980 [Armatimonadetes bacterium]|nr:hypothetical protein [Armatimonadota bacterium]